MAAASSYRYKAFLSYSHRDEAFARWLHRQLEGWRVPNDLVGRATPRGRVPSTLRPIFRDRDDFAGGHSLKEATARALEESEFLVVVCSPNAAASKYVNEEVRLFKAMGRADRIIPVIVAGLPGDRDRECFPDAVKYNVDAQGRIGSDRAEPIAADAREEGDGPPRAFAKIVAGILGIAFDEITRRAERVRRRRIAVLSGGGVGAFLFATAFSAYALYENYQADVVLDKSVFALAGMIGRIDEIDNSSDVESMRADMLMTQCDLIEGLARTRRPIGLHEQTICQNQQARALFERGPKAAAIAGMAEWLDRVRREYGRTSAPKLDLALANVKAARELYDLRDTAQDPHALDALRDLVEIAASTGRSFAASSFIRSVHESAAWKLVARLEEASDWDGSRAFMRSAADLRALQAEALGSDPAGAAAAMQQGVFLRRLGWLVHRHRGDYAVAADYSRQAVALFRRLAVPDGDAPRLQFQHALAYEVLADAQVAVGDRAAAIESYEAAIALCERALDSNTVTASLREQVAKEIAHLHRQRTRIAP
jgi:tetratricopeptide (TPR) repeat protein